MTDTTSKPVIFLAFANDRDDTVGYLRNLPDEARRLREALAPAEQAGLCEVVVRSNSMASDIFKVFQDPRYRNRIGILHYGGHANGYQLLLETAEGQSEAADAGGLAAFLAQQQGLQLVFLNGCSTQQQTDGLLAANIPCVISTSRAIDDQVATDFSSRFYQGLAGGASIRTAQAEAAAAIQTATGGNTRDLYFGAKDNAASSPETDHWPWNLYLREGSENADQWNLPEAVNDPLFGLPPLPEHDLPESPYRHLNWFTRKDSHVFFGRGHQIRELFDRLTAPRTAPILLFYGQSGVGKSSILDAGLIPRLEQDFEVRYLRRGEAGLLDTLRLAFLPEAVDVPIETAWRVKEEQTGKPLIVFLDQVEELYTRPIANLPDELDQLLKVVKAIFSDPARRPQGKLVLSFRKEWLAELEAQLVAYELPRTKVFLEPLDRRGIIEVVQGPARSERLRERYGLTVEAGLAEIIADDLWADRDSAIAPTLQILLTKMWTSTTAEKYERPEFTQELYQRLRRDGILLRDFLNQQIAAFRERYPEAVDSGLLLDIVALHTTPLGTADQKTVVQLQEQYAHLDETLPALIQQCQDLHLLTIAVSVQKESDRTTRLAHDTLAPIVREQFDQSDKPGQRARRILDNRSVDWEGDQTGTPLDEADLKVVEHGVAGTRDWSSTEQRLVEASRELRSTLRRTRRIWKVVGAVAVAVITVLGAFGWWSYKEVGSTNTALGAKTTALLAKTELANRKTKEAEDNAREANRQTANAFWQVAVVARDRLLGVEAGFNFLRAADACDQANAPIERCNAELAAQFATSSLVRSFPNDKGVGGVQFSSDESRVLAWSDDGAVKLWDVTKAEPLQVWKHDRYVRGAVFTRDESRVLAWSRDGAVKLWDVTKPEPLQVWKHDSAVRGAVFTRDESRVLTWSGELDETGDVKLWDVAKAEPLQVWKHDSAVRGAVFTRDESRVNTWSGTFRETGAVKLLDVTQAEPLQVWQHDGDVLGAVFTRDESRVLAWSLDGAVTLRNVTEAEPLQAWQHDHVVGGAVFTRNESRVLAWSADGAVKLWDVTKSEPLQVWKHDGDVDGAVFTHDESRVLAWSGDGVKLWDVTKSEPLQVWKHDGDVLGAVFTRDESRVLAWSGDGVKLWHVTKSEPLQVWKYDSEVDGAVFTRDESRVLAWGGDHNRGKGEMKLWDVMKPEPPQAWKIDSAFGGALFTRDRSRVLAWSRDGAVKLWDVTKSEPLQVWKYDSDVDGALFTRDESRVLAWSRDGAVKLWDVTKPEPLQVWKHDGNVRGAVFTRDEAHVLSWTGNGAVKLWDVTKSEPLQVWKHDSDVGGAVFTRDESRVLAWSGAGLKLWDVTKSEPLQVWKPDGNLNGAVFTRDGSRVLAWSGFIGGEVTLWDVTKAEPLQVWKHDGNVNGAVFTRDESRVLARSRDGAVKLWDVTKSEPLQVWNHDRAVYGAVFTRDESRVLAWSRDGAVNLWDVTKSESLQVWNHDSGIRGAVFTRDESRVLAWSRDGAVKLWDVTKPEPLQVWKHDRPVVGAVFTRDESRVLAWSDDGVVKLWDAALRDVNLTPTERILELEVRSATRLDLAGQLVRLKSPEWIDLVRSPEYAAIQKKKESADRSGSIK
jgi:WD40 repeat protein